MKRKNCAAVQPRDLTHAMELCLAEALKHKNLSVAGVSDLIGVASVNTFYKYLSTCSLPARLIKPFENVCDADYVSRWLVSSGNKLVIDIPRGKKCGAPDINALQTALNDAVGALLRFYSDQQDAEATLAAVQTSLECMAWHKGNVEKYRQPELPFDEE